MGILELNNMIFYSHHGCFDEEQIIGNKFVVDFSAQVDMSLPSVSDKLEDAVDYQVIYGLIKQEMEIPSKLLENVAGRILKSIQSVFPNIQSATISIAKINPPLGGVVGSSKVILSF